MTPDECLADIRARGCGVTVNAWAEDETVAVIAWRDGAPVADVAGFPLMWALEHLQERVALRWGRTKASRRTEGVAERLRGVQ